MRGKITYCLPETASELADSGSPDAAGVGDEAEILACWTALSWWRMEACTLCCSWSCSCSDLSEATTSAFEVDEALPSAMTRGN